MQNGLFLTWLLRIVPAARLGMGFGHSGFHFHRGAGILFGAKLVTIAIASIVAIAVAIMAAMSTSDLVNARYGRPEYSRIAGLAIFFVVVLVLGFGVVRFV